MRATIVFMTGRAEPRLDWMLAGLREQSDAFDDLELIIVDTRHPRVLASDDLLDSVPGLKRVHATAPKPNIWQGAHRVTKRNWWATANARNTAIALARHDYIAFVDDRAWLGSDWLQTLRKAESERVSVVCGSYDKHENPNGEWICSMDHRRNQFPQGKINCGGSWLYGCTFALPLEWALEVNGLEEGCDGLTGEDYIFGLMLANAGRRIDFVPSLFVKQDRSSPDNVSCKGTFACRDKGISPKDKSHAALERFGKRRVTEFTPNLRELREHVLRGGQFPSPDPTYDYRDWYDNELVREMDTV